MARVVMYKTAYCPYCRMAEQYLTQVKGVEVEQIDLSNDPQGRLDLMERTRQRTVPQIFVGDTHVGGYTDMRALDAKGELDPLLQA